MCSGRGGGWTRQQVGKMRPYDGCSGSAPNEQPNMSLGVATRAPTAPTHGPVGGASSTTSSATETRVKHSFAHRTKLLTTMPLVFFSLFLHSLVSNKGDDTFCRQH